MKKLNKIVGTVCISLVSMIGSANADSSAFTGGYVAITGSAIGIAMDGKHTRSTNSIEKHGATGMVGASAGAEVGFSYPLTDMFFLTAGIGMTPFDQQVDAKDITESKNIKLTTDDIVTYFIEPSFNVTENSAFFIKYGHSESEIGASGTEVTNAQYKFSGETFAIGTKTIADNGLFIKTEAGVTSYDTLKIVGILEEASGASTFTATATADVDIAYGAMTVGYKF